ncbi:PH domain-containing protein [Blastococcus saxobsidens]|uniref:PH (Pleckstrin Homology) domain-containing protein n=1 Tax=Blastococcus saxobsidens TaxID=138336 RepID=A0A4Q7Y7V9_9ACTN|nr:PH domain-containing protein [Blastococcus saxobsidens]RZU32798.1 PH (Pleckstrin Homology) domain-containing protein [Blastococcus saxobsidens]
MDPTARLRMNRTALFPVALLALCVVPLAFAAPWTPVLLLVPVVVAIWVLRTGVDITAEGLTVQALVGRRTVPWTEVAGIRVAPRGELWLVTTAGTELRLPVMRARDLPRLAQLSGGRLEVPAPPVRPKPAQ